MSPLLPMATRAVLFLALGFVCAAVFEKITKKWSLWDKNLGWQFHHSIIGLMLIAVSLFGSEYRIELLSGGVGIIIQHTLSDGLVFIRKWR